VFVEAGPDTVGEAGRRAVVAAVAGIITGFLVGGVGSRLLMRVAGAVSPVPGGRTEAGFNIDEITVGGTIALIVSVGLFAGIASAALYTLFRPWLAWARRWRGFAFGVVLFAVASASSDLMNPDNPDFFLVQNHRLVIAMIVALFVTYGVVMDHAVRWFDSRIVLGERGQNSQAMVAMACAGVVFSLPILIGVLVSNSNCDCHPSRWIAGSVAAVAAGTLLMWAGSIWPRHRALRNSGTLLGMIGVVGALAFGLARGIGDARDILP